MTIASSLLLLGSAAYLCGMLAAATAVDYRELAAAAEPFEDDASGDGGSTSTGFGGMGLLTAARAAMAANERPDSREGGGEPDDEEGGGGGGGRLAALADRPLLGPSSLRS